MEPSIQAMKSLCAIARLAYGSGSTEGTKGGSGSMGAITDKNGEVRVFKFQTHWTDRFFHTATADEKKASNALRNQLIALSGQYGVSKKVMADIRKLLGMPESGDTVPRNDKLLSRSAVAKVVKLIDGNIWDKAFSNVEDSMGKPLSERRFSSKDMDTTFQTAVKAGERGISADIQDSVFAEKIKSTAMSRARELLKTVPEALAFPREVRNVFLRTVAFAASERARLHDKKGDFAAIADHNLVRTMLAFGRVDDAKSYLVRKTGNPDAFGKNYRIFADYLRMAMREYASSKCGMSMPEVALRVMNRFHNKLDCDNLKIMNAGTDPVVESKSYELLLASVTEVKELEAQVDKKTVERNRVLNMLAFGTREQLDEITTKEEKPLVDGFKSLFESAATDRDDKFVKLMKGLNNAASNMRFVSPADVAKKLLDSFAPEQKQELAKLYRAHVEMVNREIGLSLVNAPAARLVFNALLDGCGIKRTAQCRCYDRLHAAFQRNIVDKLEQMRREGKQAHVVALKQKYGATPAEIRESTRKILDSKPSVLQALELDYDDPERTKATAAVKINELFKSLGSPSCPDGALYPNGLHDRFDRELNSVALESGTGCSFNGRNFRPGVERKDKGTLPGGDLASLSEHLKAFEEALVTSLEGPLVPAVTALISSFGAGQLLEPYGNSDDKVHFNGLTCNTALDAFTNGVRFGTESVAVNGAHVNVLDNGDVKVRVEYRCGIIPMMTFDSYDVGNDNFPIFDGNVLDPTLLSIEFVVPHDWSIATAEEHPIQVTGLSGHQPSGLGEI